MNEPLFKVHIFIVLIPIVKFQSVTYGGETILLLVYFNSS